MSYRSRRAPVQATWLSPALLATAGLALVAAGALVQLTSAPAVPAALGDVPAARPSPSSSAGLPAGPAASTANSRSATVARARVPAAAAFPAAVPPVSVRLPHGERASIVTAGTDGQGRLDPPAQVRNVGWWPGGAALGSAQGTVVLVGHVDAASQGLGVFAHLRDARPGQTVTLTGSDGRRVTYRITARRSYPRSQPLPAQVFAADVAPRLALITCTGRFDPASAHYSDSLVVYAVPGDMS